MSFAFSGGGATLEEHKQHGANLEVDVAYQVRRVHARTRAHGAALPLPTPRRSGSPFSWTTTSVWTKLRASTAPAA